MTYTKPVYPLRIARDHNDLLGAERLRYKVFVEELGGDGEMVDHEGRYERDAFDPHADHLILTDASIPPESHDHVIGVYRVMRDDQARGSGGFYSEAEFDLSALKSSGRRLLELGRSCLQIEHRGGTAMYQLWQGLADYVARHQIEVLFGVASFHGQDVDLVAEPLSLLHHEYLAPKEIRPISRNFRRMDLIPRDQINRPAAMRATPALIKAYLRLGGVIGEGAYIDHAFNTIDVCLMMDTARLSARHHDIYIKDRRS